MCCLLHGDALEKSVAAGLMQSEKDAAMGSGGQREKAGSAHRGWTEQPVVRMYKLRLKILGDATKFVFSA